MLTVPESVCIYLAAGPTDMRKSFDTLAALTRDVIGQDPRSGHLFVFCNRNRDRLKILHWESSGLAIEQAARKERSRGRRSAARVTLTATSWRCCSAVSMARRENALVRPENYSSA
jgi:transposase